MIQIKKISIDNIQSTIKQASELGKKRIPLLLNKSIDEIPQTFINCLSKDAYIRPHKHPNKYQLEQFSIICGEATVLIFDDIGTIIDRFILSPKDIVLAEIPYNIYHTVFTDTGCAFLEIRNHAYNQNTDKEHAIWSPSEDDILASSIYYNQLIKAENGELCVIKSK